MIKTEQKITTESAFDFSLVGPKERIVFFDIETTGLKAGSSQLYLIGTATFEDGGWVLRQFFAESPGEEMVVLKSFKDLVNSRASAGRPILVSYNGDTFDIPYLKSVGIQYGLGDIFQNTISFDLYRFIKPCKEIMGTPNMRLKTVEKLCGICREDTYDGGELIYVYEEFLRLKNILKGGCEDNELNDGLKENCLKCLLLHNAEDVADMPKVMELYGYRLLKDGDFDFLSAEVIEVPKVKGKSGLVLDVKFKLRTSLPKEFYKERPGMTVSASGEDPLLLELCLDIYCGELRYYFVDYKNYYYLPAEDRAVHKSLASFVPADHRVKATAATCYTRKEGRFFPEPAPIFVPVFHETKDGTRYAELTEEALADGEKWKELLLALL